MSERPYRSIGEVLALLREEFPDVTISKIRFLESQGLVDPERTLSGYRKFYDGDVTRLRWILRQQRENYLPLKVIKDRLAEDPAPWGGLREVAEVADTEAGDAPSPPADPTPRQPAAVAVGSTRPSSPSPRREAAAVSTAMPLEALGATASGIAEAAFDTGASLSFEELVRASGLDADAVAELERFGLIEPSAVGQVVSYDEEALHVARLAAAFARYGVEARHLRMYRTGAEREAGVFEQVVLPMVKQRNPQARRRAGDTVDDLARLGDALHGVLLRRALRPYAEGR